MAFELTREFNINLQGGGGIGALVRSKTDLTPADVPVFIAGDTYTIRVRLLTPSGTVGQAPTPTPISAGGVLKLAARPANNLEEDFVLFESGTFTEVTESDPADVYYQATLNLNTTEFRDAVDADSPLDLLIDLEVQNSGNTARMTIPQFRATGRQQVYRGDEPPVSVQATWPTRPQIVRFLAGVTGLTGGGSTNLDGITTVGQSIGLVKFRHTDGVLRTYRLVAGTDAESSPNVIRPDDYNGSTNAFVWKLESEGTTGTGVPSERSITAAGLASGGGNLSADRTITVTESSQAQAEAGLDGTTAMTPRRVAQAIAALAPADSGGGGLTTGKVYGFTTNGAAAAYDTIDAAIQATSAAGGGGVWIPAKQTPWNEQVCLRPNVAVTAEGGANIHYSGIGTVIIEAPESVTATTPNSVQQKILGNGNWRKVVTNACRHGGTIAISAIDTGTETITTALPHGLEAGMQVMFDESTTAPTGLASGPYFVIAAGLTATQFRVSETAGGAAQNISSAGTNPRVRRVFRAEIASIGTHTSGVTTVTTTAAHGFPKYFHVSFTGTTTTPSLTTGTYWAERLSDTTFAIRASVTTGQGSAAGRCDMQVEEHCIRVRHASSHLDAIGEHFDIFVLDGPQTNAARFSSLHCKGGILHARNHTFRGRNASVLHMVSGFPDLHADGGCLGSGAGVATLSFDGDGTSPAAGFPTSRFWLRSFRLEASANQPAVRIRGNFPDVFIHLETQTWNGRFLVHQLSGGAVWLFFNVQSMAWAEDRSVGMTAPVFEVQPQGAGAVLLNGKIDLLTGTHEAPVLVINNASNGLENEHHGLVFGEVSSEPAGATDGDEHPGIIATGRPGERFTLNIGAFRRYRPHFDPTVLPVGIRLIGNVTLRGTFIFGCTNEVGVGGEIWDNCRFVPPLFQGEEAEEPEDVVPCVRSFTGQAVEAVFLNCYKSNQVALENVTGAGSEVPVYRPIAPQDRAQIAISGTLTIAQGDGELVIASQPTWYPGEGLEFEYQWSGDTGSGMEPIEGATSETLSVSVDGSYQLALTAVWGSARTTVQSNTVSVTL